MRILSSSERYIDVEIGVIGDPNHWRFTGFYGHLVSEERMHSWNLIRRLAASSSLSWVIGGDFNELLSIHEKEGGL